MNKSVIFSVNNLTKKVRKRIIVDNLSFEGCKGEILGFLGPNGAGKTTTIKMMTGISSITDGSITICGNDIDKDFEKAIINVGAVVETPYMYENMTGLQNINYFAEVRGTAESDIEKIIKLTGLQGRLSDKVSKYSLGMKQRLGIGIALLGNPSLLILDEPTNGLDPDAIIELRTFLCDLAHKQGICIFVSSHILAEMEKLCDRVIIIDKGKLIGEADLNAIKSEDGSLEEFYAECIRKFKGGIE